MITRRLIFAITLIALAACQPETVTLPDDEATSYATEVNSVVENMLVGLNEQDYEKHAQDFDEDLRKQIDAVAFLQIYDEIIGKIGAYQSRTLVNVEDIGRFRAVIYDAAFERDPHVTIRVVFWKNDPEHHIAGLWFDSVLLRKTTE